MPAAQIPGSNHGPPSTPCATSQAPVCQFQRHFCGSRTKNSKTSFKKSSHFSTNNPLLQIHNNGRRKLKEEHSQIQSSQKKKFGSRNRIAIQHCRWCRSRKAAEHCSPEQQNRQYSWEFRFFRGKGMKNFHVRWRMGSTFSAQSRVLGFGFPGRKQAETNSDPLPRTPIYLRFWISREG